MAFNARVGIVLRTKNRPWFLARALADIGAQEYEHWRLHIVDDGGDPGLVDIAIESLNEDVRRRVSVTHNRVALGRSAAANIGVRALDTEFVVLHDDDDLWSPVFLSRTVAWLDAHSEDIGVVARTEIVYEVEADGGKFVEIERAPFWADLHEITYIDLIEVNRWVPIAYLYRRQLHERVGFYNEQIHAAEDWDFGLRTLVRHHVGFLDGAPLAYWMQRREVTGELGNSMFALAHEHLRYDKDIRDAAVREYALTHGSGLLLYLSRLIKEDLRRTVRDDIREIVQDELRRELDARPSDLDRIRRRLTRWRLRA